MPGMLQIYTAPGTCSRNGRPGGLVWYITPEYTTIKSVDVMGSDFSTEFLIPQ